MKYERLQDSNQVESAPGYLGTALATGSQVAAIATGERGLTSATSDCGVALATGARGTAAAAGYLGVASATGYLGSASATGDQGVAMSCGYKGKARASSGNALFLVERNDNHKIVAVWAGIAGLDRIKADVFYRLVDGVPTEVTL
uniref:Head decoration protein n=1 Tax=Xanthomonas phage MK21 TaxID=3148942 RepID=A0AAU7J8H0_9CAUD